MTQAQNLSFMIPTSGRVSSGFGMRKHPITHVMKGHAGIDIAPGNNSPDNSIVATADGVVTFVGKKNGYGNVIIIKHADGYESVYAHNRRNYAKVGDIVQQGNTIGVVGSTGRSTGPHLHFEIRKNGKPVNPADLLPGNIVVNNWVKSSPSIVQAKRYSSNTMQWHGINPDEKITDSVKGLDVNNLIPQTLRRSLTGKAAAYSFSQGDAFSALTILSEGVGKGEAFYYDPASNNGKHKTLINTHPGITLPMQSDKTLRSMFDKTSISHLEDEIFNVVRSGRKISPKMESARLTFRDYHTMFNEVRGYYEKVAENAMIAGVKNNPHAQALLKKGVSPKEIAAQAINNLPETSYAVLQHAAYKLGNLNNTNMKKVVQAALSAGLDVKHQQQHLIDGAKNINYFYDTAKAKAVADTRVATLHRTFFISGTKINPNLAVKIATDQDLNEREVAMMGKIAQQAGVQAQIQGNKMVIPNDAPELAEAKERGERPVFNDSASAIPSIIMRTEYKPTNTSPSAPVVSTPTTTASPSVFVTPTSTPTVKPSNKPTPSVNKHSVDPYGAAFGASDF